MDQEISELVDSPLSLALSEIASSHFDCSLELLQSAVREKISQLQPSSEKDKMVSILNGFINHLPDRGSKVVCRYIEENEDNLVALAKHLFKLVLLPSKFIILQSLLGHSYCRN